MKIPTISLQVISIIVAGTLYLSLSGFQCASSQMNTAELAMGSSDFAKARSALKEEVELRPTNAKAWFLLGRSEYHLGNLAEMASDFKKAIEHRSSDAGPLDGEAIGIMSQYSSMAWGDVVGRSRDAAQEKQYSLSLAQLDTADIVQPGNPISISSRAVVLQNAGNPKEAAQMDSKYISTTKESIEAGLSQGLVLGMNAEKVHTKLGRPQTPYNMTGHGVQSSCDVYLDKGLAIYYSNDKAGAQIVSGWDRISADHPPYFNYRLSSNPYYNRAFVLRENKEYDEAISILTFAEKFDPTRSGDVGNLLGQIYIDAGRLVEAEQEIKRRLALDPEDVRLHLRHSVLQYSAGDTAAAINTLETALTVKSLEEGSKEHLDILYNLAAYYKNWGYELDQLAEEMSRSEATPLKKEALTYYNASLRHFETVDKLTPKFDSDLSFQIGNIYAIVQDEIGLKKIISKFEANQAAPAFAENAKFWRSLAKLYLWGDDEDNGKKALALAKKYQ